MNKKIRFLVSSFALVFLMGTTLTEAAAAKLTSAYLYSGTKATYSNQVNQTKGSVQIVHPDYLTLDSNANLSVTNKLDPAFIQEQQKKGIKVVPYLSNHFDRALGKKALQNKTNLVDQLVSFVSQYNVDGLNIDIENIDHNDKDDFTAFIKLLREKLPKTKQLTVAIPANPNKWTTGWHGAYDNKALASYVDYLFLMAYDESWDGDTTPGPVASYPWVEKSIQTLLAEGVSAQKIMLGVPFYGRYWNDSESKNGASVTMNALYNEWQQKYNMKITYDETQKSYKGTFTVAATDMLPKGNYTVWFDGENSLKEKINLVHKYDLLGVGAWALSQEHSTTWDYFTAWVTQSYYQVYRDGTLLKEFKTLSEATAFAKNYEKAYVIDAKTQKTVWENHPITYETNRITFTKQTNFYKSPSEKENVWSSFQPITLVSFATKKTNDTTWYLVKTWLGASWVKSDNANVTQVQNQKQTMTLYKQSSISSTPFDSTVATISPQNVTVLYTWENWAKIQTWLGEKWIKRDFLVEGTAKQEKKKIQLQERVNLYHSPISSENTGATIAPQMVNVAATHNGWLKIQTWLGEKWIKPAKYSVVEEEKEESFYERITLSKTTSFYGAPYSTSPEGHLGAQTVQAVSKKGSWFKINTWLGEKWIQVN